MASEDIPISTPVRFLASSLLRKQLSAKYRVTRWSADPTCRSILACGIPSSPAKSRRVYQPSNSSPKSHGRPHVWRRHRIPSATITPLRLNESILVRRSSPSRTTNRRQGLMHRESSEPRCKYRTDKKSFQYLDASRQAQFRDTTNFWPLDISAANRFCPPPSTAGAFFGSLLNPVDDSRRTIHPVIRSSRHLPPVCRSQVISNSYRPSPQ